MDAHQKDGSSEHGIEPSGRGSGLEREESRTESIPPAFAGTRDDASIQATIAAIATAIAACPVLGAASVIAGIYGAYSSYEMGQAMSRVEQLAQDLVAELAALKVEIEQLKINEIVSSAQASIISLRDIETLGQQDRNNLILTAATNVEAKSEEAAADVGESLSFVHPYFLCISLLAEVLKRKRQYVVPGSVELRDALNAAVQRGNGFISQVENHQRSRVGGAQVTIRQVHDHLGEVMATFYTYYYSVDGNNIVVYGNDDNPPASAMADTERAQAKGG